MSKERILQMVAADGWYVKFADQDGDSLSRKLICWVLVERDGESEVEQNG